MNLIEKKMLDILRTLKTNYGVLAVKAEFEAEGSRTDELIKLNEIVFRADMDIFIKIGGCEAVRDLDQCKLLGAKGIMAPMIETPFAMKKFSSAAKKVYGDELKNIEWIINTETITCYNNINSILDAGNNFLNTIAVGRVDLSGSMDLSRNEINSQKIFDMTKQFAIVSREKGLKVGIGGGISFDAIPFITEIFPYVDKFETRKIIFTINNDPKILREGILLAMEFETLYLQNKCEFYDLMAKEDKARMLMLQERLKIAQGE